VFFIALIGMIALDAGLKTDGSYISGLELTPLFDSRGRDALLGLFTLRYVPHYFDILPMYLVVLAMVPVIMALAAINRIYAFAFMAVVWAIAATGRLDLPAEPWAERTWFFNPFSWQLIFFAGFAFMSGWIPAPPVNRRLIGLATAVLVFSIPFAWAGLWDRFDALGAIRAAAEPLIDKPHFGLLRFAHFLSLAYLAYVLAGENGRYLQGRLVEILRKFGQQSLAVFMSGLVLSFFASALLNYTGRGIVAVAAVNCGGILILIGLARTVAWFKSNPWQAPVHAPPAYAATTLEPRRPPAAAQQADETLHLSTAG
jgi:hypothetical protein